MATKTTRTENTRVFWYTKGNGGPERHTETNGQEYVTYIGTDGVVRECPGSTGTSYWTFNGDVIENTPKIPGGMGIPDLRALERMADGADGR